jgi:drug/metabolite transporter (DMT)-like permease
MMQFVGMLAAIALTAVCWGVYGPVLHFGRESMHSALRPFMCVGAAYFLIAVLIPVLLLARGGERGGWTSRGVLWSLAAGACGALGALGVILALSFGGKPIYVMPLVFGGAPVVNTLLTATLNKAFDQLKAPFLAGLLLVIMGAVTVLVFKPHPQLPAAAPAAAAVGVDDDTDVPTVAPPKTVEKKAERFVEILLATALAMVSWGAYGPVLHRGQAAMGGSRLRPLVCIGAAYFLIAVLVPLALLVPLGDQGNWNLGGSLWSLGAGSLGALGALGTILAFNWGGKPFTVMPVVFGCAPVINTLTTLALAHTPAGDVSPWFLAGMLIVALGAATVLLFGPRGHAVPPKPTAA